MTLSYGMIKYSILSGRTSYRKISWSFEAARFRFKLFQSLWNLTGTSAAALQRCLQSHGFETWRDLSWEQGRWTPLHSTIRAVTPKSGQTRKTPLQINSGFREIFITGFTGTCQNDHFESHQWSKCRQNDMSFSMKYTHDALTGEQ